jgi:hypothetical protein
MNLKTAYTKRTALNHYFGNYVGMARSTLISGNPDGEMLEELKSGFVDGLKGKIDEGVPDYGKVTAESLGEIIEFAKDGDWKDIGVIKELYRRVCDLKGKEFNEQELFGNED